MRLQVTCCVAPRVDLVVIPRPTGFCRMRASRVWVCAAVRRLPSSNDLLSSMSLSIRAVIGITRASVGCLARDRRAVVSVARVDLC
jgi:hypothetical protein